MLLTLNLDSTVWVVVGIARQSECQTAAVGIFTNIGAFGGFCHGNPVSIERVHSGDFGIEKARKRRIVGVCGLLDRWQGQKDLNPRHAVLEAMLKFLSRSDFSPILGICCQPRR